MVHATPGGSGSAGVVTGPVGARHDVVQAFGGLSRSDADAEFWLRHLNLGLILYGVSIAAALAYLLLVPGPNRGPLFVLAGVAVGSVLLVLALPRRAIAASPRRMVFFSLWSAFSVAFVLTVSALDGGADSPLILILIYPLVFSGLAYPPRAVAAATTGAASGYFALIVTQSSSRGFPLMAMVVLVGVGFVSAAAAAARERVRSTLDALATHDGLTGCLTHRAFHDLLSLEVARASRHNRPVAVVIVDLDHFKQVNDGFGHLAGDELLRTVGAALRASLRPGDAAGRIGGDEFALMLPDTALDGAMAFARRRLEELCAAGVSATFGVAQTCPGDAATGATTTCTTGTRHLVSAADRALYRAKELGRSRVESHVCGCTVTSTAAEA